MKNQTLHGLKSWEIINKLFCYLVLIILISGLLGCTEPTTNAGSGGIEIRDGNWIGQNEDGSYYMELTIGTKGENLLLTSFSYPCGERNVSTFLPLPIKIPLSYSTFAGTIDDKSHSPKVAGKFIDSTHAEGTWETIGYRIEGTDFGCPAESGTWEAVPE